MKFIRLWTSPSSPWLLASVPFMVVCIILTAWVQSVLTSLQTLFPVIESYEGKCCPFFLDKFDHRRSKDEAYYLQHKKPWTVNTFKNKDIALLRHFSKGKD